jgi:hypothetical protein
METKTETNIYLVAAYLAFGAKLSVIDRDNPKHVRFIVRGRDLSNLEVSWLNGELQGDLCRYAEAVRTVKAALYSR